MPLGSLAGMEPDTPVCGGKTMMSIAKLVSNRRFVSARIMKAKTVRQEFSCSCLFWSFRLCVYL